MNELQALFTFHNLVDLVLLLVMYQFGRYDLVSKIISLFKKDKV